MTEFGTKRDPSCQMQYYRPVGQLDESIRRDEAKQEA